jgi:hypothetical protein
VTNGLTDGVAAGQSPAATPVLDAAIGYARAGLPVLPLAQKGKVPLIRGGLTRASTDPSVIASWWQRCPDANIGIRTGSESGLVVLDVDLPAGLSELHELERRHGKLTTARSLTGSGGSHYWFRHPGRELRNSAGKLGDGLDVRGDGGFAVAPPSVHESGNLYKWVRTLDHAEECPAWLLADEDALRRSTAATRDIIPEGERDSTLASLAGSMRRQGMQEPEIRAALVVANHDRCRPPLAERDVERIAASISRYAPALRNQMPRIRWQRGSDVELRPIVFRDKPLLQADAFHLVAGRKGQGKGTLLARFATSVNLGDLGPKRNVLWIGSEDSAGIDIVPRIVVAGGDPERLLLVREGWLQLPRDLDEISGAIDQFGDVGMVVIDPIANHIAGKDSNAEEVREAIAPLDVGPEHVGSAERRSVAEG